MIIEGSLEAKLPTIWRDENGTARKKLGRGESQKREDAGARKGRKVAKHCVFPMFCGSGGSESRLAKAAGAEVAGQMRNENLHAMLGPLLEVEMLKKCTPLWREAHLEVKSVKIHWSLTTFGS